MLAPCVGKPRSFASVSGRSSGPSRRIVHARTFAVAAFKVEIDFEGTKHMLDVPDDKTILEVALDNDLALPHDCKLGVCMTCPAKLVRTC
jgi:ferredoxin